MKIILASSSPQRSSLLEKIGVYPSDIISPNINEDIKPKEKPTDYVKRISLEKANNVLSKIDPEPSFIISADTAVIKGTKIIGKPKDIVEAEKTLKMLSGGRHKVLTSFNVLKVEQGVVLSSCSNTIKTQVLVKRLSKSEIEWYLQTKEWEGKSGSYAIQGKFEVFIKQINGSISNVVGLPLMQVYNALNGLGYKII